MKWTKIKTLLLSFLLAMNIFMLIIITVTSGGKTKISKEVVESSISVLKRSGFEINLSTFPDSYYTLPSYNATFYSAGDLSNLFFKKQVAFSTTGNSLIATKDDAVLTVSGNRFIFESKSSPVKSSPDALKDELEKSGINMEGAVYDEKQNCFYRMYNKVNLFNMSIQAKLDKNGKLCYVNAYWPKNLTNIKKERFSFLESAIKLKEAFPSGGKVEKIELGYELRPVSDEKYIFIPAWRVQVNGELKIVE